jgi:hypothetical protein
MLLGRIITVYRKPSGSHNSTQKKKGYKCGWKRRQQLQAYQNTKRKERESLGMVNVCFESTPRVGLEAMLDINNNIVHFIMSNKSVNHQIVCVSSQG